jgi:hypothetical protein
MDQLRKFPTNEAFFIKADALKSRLFEVVLTSPTVVTEPDGYKAVQAKAQLNHIVVPQGEGNNFKLLNVPKKSGSREGQFNKGHYTPVLNFGKNLVADGLLTQSDIDNLINYAAIWEANGDQNYAKGTEASKQRCWLTARTIQGYITFIMTERQDTEGNMVPAVENLCWTPGDFSVIGSGITENAQNVNKAPKLILDVPTTAPNVATGVAGRALV